MFQAGDVVETDFEGFLKLLRSKTRAFVTIDNHEYYITHTDGYWRVQDCEALNDKGHFTDCSELVNTVCEVVELPWICGKSLHDSFAALRSTSRRCLTGNKTRFSRDRWRRPRAGGLFLSIGHKSASICGEPVDDSQNSD